MSRVKLVEKGIETGLMELLEKEDLVLDKLIAELETANTKYSAAYTMWLQHPVIKELKGNLKKANHSLQEQVKNTMQRLELDPKDGWTYNIVTRQFERNRPN